MPKTGCILVVDDAPLSRMLLGVNRRADSHEVVEAENERLALENLAEVCVDLALMDIEMPEIDLEGAAARVLDSAFIRAKQIQSTLFVSQKKEREART